MYMYIIIPKCRCPSIDTDTDTRLLHLYFNLMYPFDRYIFTAFVQNFMFMLARALCDCALCACRLSSMNIMLDTIDTDSQTTQYNIKMKIAGIAHYYSSSA